MSSGEIFATQFFLSQKLKFILFLPTLETYNSASAIDEFLDSWRSIAAVFKGASIFSFAYVSSGGVGDVSTFFGIDLEHDVPAIVAHDPSTDSRYRSEKIMLSSSSISKHRSIQEFVSGVVTGKVEKILKSQPENERRTGDYWNILGFNFPGFYGSQPQSSSILSAVGNTVKAIVSEENRDVLLCVYTSWCPKCSDVLPTLEVSSSSSSSSSSIYIYIYTYIYIRRSAFLVTTLLTRIVVSNSQSNELLVTRTCILAVFGNRLCYAVMSQRQGVRCSITYSNMK